MTKDDKSKITSFSLKLNEKEAGRLMKLLSDEGLMRAGFVSHQSNNLVLSVDLKPIEKK